MSADAGPVLASLSEPRCGATTQLFVAADAHVTPTESGTWKVLHRSETRLRAAVDAGNDLDVDATLFLGDLTCEGRPEEYAVVDEVLADLAGPFLAVPGNHDVPKRWDDYEAPTATAFGERYGRGGYPFHARVGGLDLLCLDTASGDGSLTDTHEGAVTTRQLEWLESRLNEATAPVVAMHHALCHPRQHLGPFPEGEFYRLRNADALRAVLERADTTAGSPLVLSGHLHWPATATAAGARELVAPATCSFPQAGLLLEAGPDGTTVRFVPLAGPQGVTEAYVRADAGNAHGQGLAAYADQGWLSSFPLADERTANVGADVPGGVRWR